MAFPGHTRLNLVKYSKVFPATRIRKRVPKENREDSSEIILWSYIRAYTILLKLNQSTMYGIETILIKTFELGALDT